MGPAAPLKNHTGAAQGHSTISNLTGAPRGTEAAGSDTFSSGVPDFLLGLFSYLLIQETAFG